MKKWSVIETEYLHKSPYGSIRKDKCLLPSGSIINEYLLNEYADWVNIVAITKMREIIMVKQYRHGCADFVLEIPAGSVVESESMEGAILRELREETGFVSQSSPILLGSFYTNPAISNNKIHTYYIEDCEKIYEQNLDDTEDIEIITYPLDILSDIISSGEISQLFSFTAIMLAIEHMKVLRGDCTVGKYT